MHDPIEHSASVAGTTGADADFARREIAQALKLSVLFGEDRLARRHLDAGVSALLRAHCGLGPEPRST